MEEELHQEEAKNRREQEREDEREREHERTRERESDLHDIESKWKHREHKLSGKETRKETNLPMRIVI